MKKFLVCLLFILTLISFCAVSLAVPDSEVRPPRRTAAAARDALAPPTGFTLWGYSDQYLIFWFNELHDPDSTYNENWKEEFRVFTRTSAGAAWTDVTDVCITAWSMGGEIYCPATFSNGTTVEVAIAACDAEGNLGEYVTDSFKYYKSNCGPIQNLRAKVQDKTLYAVWDSYSMCADVNLEFGYYTLDVLIPEMGNDELGDPHLIFGQGIGKNTKYKGWGTEYYSLSELDHFQVKVDAVLYNKANPNAGHYYYPDKATAVADMKKGNDGQWRMYLNGELVDTSSTNFDPDPVTGWDPAGVIYKFSGSNAYVIYDDVYAYFTVIDIPAAFTYDGRTYTVAGIDANAFKDQSQITKVTLGKNVKTIGGNAFSGCTGLKTVSGGEGVTTIGESAFSGCKALKTFPAMNKVTVINGSSFKGCSALTKFTLGAKVKMIGNNAFASCTKLAAVSGGEAVTAIGDSAFSGCKALKTFQALSKLQTIGGSAFKDCVKLAKFTLAKNVKSIGKNAFNNCKALKDITVKTEKLTASNVKAGAFKGINSKATFSCPKKKLKDYAKLFVKKGAPKTAKFK